jgi:hypothetical protein
MKPLKIVVRCSPLHEELIYLWIVGQLARTIISVVSSSHTKHSKGKSTFDHSRKGNPLQKISHHLDNRLLGQYGIFYARSNLCV